MEIARHWRLRHQRLRPPTGSRRELEGGRIEFKLAGSTTWFEARHNGYHQDEDPLERRIIYQAPSEENAIPLQIHAEEEISA